MTETTTEWQLDDAAAEYFEAHFVPAIFGAWAPIIVDAGGVSQGQRVLDVACGTGVVARTAADRLEGNGSVVGLDLNPSMIKVASRLRSDIEWHEGDVTRMPFPEGSFDVVLCQAGLMFFPEPVAALLEMRRVLRPGGRLALLVWGRSRSYDDVAALLEASTGKEVADIFRAPFSMAEPRRVVELLVKAGFDSPELRTLEEPARFPSVEAFLKTEVDGWVLKGRVDVAALLPAARKTLDPYVDADGCVSLPMAGHIVTATKR